MTTRYGNSEALATIIDDMESRYDLYNWATMKESDKEENFFVMVDNSARKIEVELNGLSKDDQKKQRLTLFAVSRASATEVKDAVARVKKVFVRLTRKDLPIINPTASWDSSQTVRRRILNDVRNLLRGDDVLKSLMEQRRMSMVMFPKNNDISLTGWHYKSNMEVLEGIHFQDRLISRKVMQFTIGFMFNFKIDDDNSNCDHGNELDLSFEAGSFRYCLCAMGYGGESCDVSLDQASKPTLSNSVLKMVQIYKVPGMFDLQNDIKNGTDTIMRQLENNKQQIFSAIRQTGSNVRRTENAILSAQSIMLNQLRADNAKVLNGLSGLQKAMDAAIEKNRNDFIYQTNEGRKVVIQTISDANRKVTDGIKKLAGKVIENRYFGDIKVHVPVFQDRFETAIAIGSPMAEKRFSEYKSDNEQQFQASKESIKSAMVEKEDSFVMARMQIAMDSGCTEQYTREIKSTWADLMELHLAMTTIDMWDLDYKIRSSTSDPEIIYLEQLKNRLESSTKSDTDEIKMAYNSRSCKTFSMPDLLGGGCAASTTYRGQTVPMRCSDPNKTLILSSGRAISEVVCSEKDDWTVNVTDLTCISKCQDADDGRFYGVGEKKKLPKPPSGYFWADGSGNVVTEKTCVAFDKGISSTTLN